MVASCGIVVSSSSRVRESVVGIVDLLELPGAGCTFGRVGGHTVRVVLERLPVGSRQTCSLTESKETYFL